VRYAEASFSLPDHAERFDDWDGPVRGVLEGLAEGERFGIRCRVYVDVVRGIDMALSRRAMETAAAYLDDGVIGIGLGGEERFPPEPYAEIFRESRRRGLRSMPHAGETPAPRRSAARSTRSAPTGSAMAPDLEDTQLVEEVLARGSASTCPPRT
jgi:adenosine deaminase